MFVTGNQSKAVFHRYSSKKAGIPQSTVARIEGLTHGLPKLSTLQKIADALNNASVAQLDRAMVFETIGHRFESCQTHEIKGEKI